MHSLPIHTVLPPPPHNTQMALSTWDIGGSLYMATSKAVCFEAHTGYYLTSSHNDFILESRIGHTHHLTVRSCSDESAADHSKVRTRKTLLTAERLTPAITMPYTRGQQVYSESESTHPTCDRFVRPIKCILPYRGIPGTGYPCGGLQTQLGHQGLHHCELHILPGSRSADMRSG